MEIIADVELQEIEQVLKSGKLINDKHRGLMGIILSSIINNKDLRIRSIGRKKEELPNNIEQMKLKLISEYDTAISYIQEADRLQQEASKYQQMALEIEKQARIRNLDCLGEEAVRHMWESLSVSDLFKKFLDNMGGLTESQAMELLAKINMTYPGATETSKDDSSLDISCAKCGGRNIRKHGFKNGRQRYYCKDCGKTFVSSTGTITFHSRLAPEQWKGLIRGLVENLSLSKIADSIGTSVPTAWYNKQKICAALAKAYGAQDNFIDIAECDEYYTALSFKGKRDPSFFINTLNRMPRRHRTYEEKVKYLMENGFWAALQGDPRRLAMLLGSTNSYSRGIGYDKTCILTCKDRNENLYVNPVSIGNLGTADVKKHLSGRFAPDAIMVTDSHASYPGFARSEHIQLEQIESGKYTKGAYNLGRINAVHSKLAKYLSEEGERLPATKYLDLSLMLFWWLEKNAKLSIREKVEKLYKIVTENTGMDNITYEAVTNRELTINTKGLIPKKV